MADDETNTTAYWDQRIAENNARGASGQSCLSSPAHLREQRALAERALAERALAERALAERAEREGSS